MVSRITLRRECVAGNLLNSNILRYQAPWRRYALYRVPFWFTHIRFGVCRFYIHECSPDYQTASRNQAFFSLDTPDHLLALRHHIDLSLLVDYTATIGNILRVASQQVAWSYEFGLSSSKLRRNDTFQQNCSTLLLTGSPYVQTIVHPYSQAPQGNRFCRHIAYNAVILHRLEDLSPTPEEWERDLPDAWRSLLLYGVVKQPDAPD